MRSRTLIVLFLVVAGLAAFIWFVERDLPGSDERAESAKRLLDLEVESIIRLEIESASGRVVMERTAGGVWGLTEPLVARADDSAVDGLLARLTVLEKERTFTEGSAEELGLAPARATIGLASAEGDARLLIGGEVPASSSMIVAAASEGPFHVVGAVAESEVARTASDWRSRSIFPHSREAIERLTLELGEGSVTIARRGEDYFLESPLEDRADEGTVSRLLDALVGLEAIEFLAEVEEDDFAARQALVVETSGGEGPWRLEVGRARAAEGEEPARATIRAEGHVYLAEDRLREALERPADEWRSLEWGTRQVFEIDRLEVLDGVGTLALERDGADWMRDGERVEYSPVSDLLYAITGTKGEALGAEEAIAGVPLVTATINPGDEAQVLRIFPPSGDRYPATASDRDAALWLGGDRVRSILSNLAQVRAAAVVPEIETEGGEPGSESPEEDAPGSD